MAIKHIPTICPDCVNGNHCHGNNSGCSCRSSCRGVPELNPNSVEAFEQRFAANLTELEGIHDNKRKRYTGGLDPLLNYLTCSEWIARMLEQEHPEAAGFVRSRGALFAMMARLGEKFQRMATMIGSPDFFDRGQGEDESFKDTTTDVAVISQLIEIDSWRLRENETLDTPIPMANSDSHCVCGEGCACDGECEGGSEHRCGCGGGGECGCGE